MMLNTWQALPSSLYLPEKCPKCKVEKAPDGISLRAITDMCVISTVLYLTATICPVAWRIVLSAPGMAARASLFSWSAESVPMANSSFQKTAGTADFGLMRMPWTGQTDADGHHCRWPIRDY